MKKLGVLNCQKLHYFHPLSRKLPHAFFLIKNSHKILYFIDNYFLLVSCYKASMCFAYDVNLYLISLEI